MNVFPAWWRIEKPSVEYVKATRNVGAGVIKKIAIQLKMVTNRCSLILRKEKIDAAKYLPQRQNKVVSCSSTIHGTCY